MVRQRLLIALLALSALSLAGDCRSVRIKPQGPGEVIPLLQQFADRFVPFVSYPLDDCFAVWPDTGELLAALEIHRLDPSLGIEPELAGPYVRHLAGSVLAQTYDPNDPGTWGPCRYGPPLPNPTSAVSAMAYMLKRYGEDWSAETREAIRRAIHLPDWRYNGDAPHVYNKSVPFPAMHLLFGEAACHEPSWSRGWGQVQSMYERHLKQGGFEANDRHYTMFHLANLGMLGALDTPTPRMMAEYLFDLKSLLSAHFYLPGGHIGVLNTRMSRDPYFFPGTQREQSTGPVLEALAAGDDFAYAYPGLYVARPASVVVAVIDRLPQQIRRLFLNKGDGYEAWWLMRNARGASRYPGTLSNLGEAGKSAFAWQIHVLPGGTASMGTSYGVWVPAFGNSEAVAVRCPSCEQGFAFTYQWQPCASGDTDDAGDGICSPGESDPRHVKEPGYDVERMQVHRSRISLWDPRSRTSRWPDFIGDPVPRQNEFTQAYLTNWDHPSVGGEKIFPTPGGWYVGRLGGVFIAYRPLGDSFSVSQLDGSRLLGGTNIQLATFFQIDGRSGGITVLATADEFPGETLGDFAVDMDSRYWSFTAAGPNDGPVAEFDHRGANGTLCRMKLEYMGLGGLPGAERRYVDCSASPGTQFQELGEAEFFSALHGGQLMTSPHVSYDVDTDILTVHALVDLTYDWGALRLAGETIETPNACVDRGYLELGEPPEVELTTSAGAVVPSFDVLLENTGFAATTVAIAFEGEACTADGTPPGVTWLLPPGNVSVAAGETATIAVSGGAPGCDPGEAAGELIFSSVEGNALDARLPVRLTVTP